MSEWYIRAVDPTEGPGDGEQKWRVSTWSGVPIFIVKAWGKEHYTVMFERPVGHYPFAYRVGEFLAAQAIALDMLGVTDA